MHISWTEKSPIKVFEAIYPDMNPKYSGYNSGKKVHWLFPDIWNIRVWLSFRVQQDYKLSRF